MCWRSEHRRNGLYSPLGIETKKHLLPVNLAPPVGMASTARLGLKHYNCHPNTLQPRRVGMASTARLGLKPGVAFRSD